MAVVTDDGEDSLSYRIITASKQSGTCYGIGLDKRYDFGGITMTNKYKAARSEAAFYRCQEPLKDATDIFDAFKFTLSSLFRRTDDF